MKALCWNNKHRVSVENVPDPKIEHPRDAIIRVTTTAICGSDLHLYDGLVQTMKRGDVLGHEPMGEVIELGPEVTNLKVGDRVVVPFTISCGDCLFCKQTLYSLCDDSNPNAEMTAKLYGSAPAGLFGFSHMYGGYAGGQAQYLRVPFADVGPIVIPEHLPDEQVLFLVGYFPDRLHGGGELQYPARRYCSCVGRRAGRAVCYSQRLSLGCEPRHRD